MGLAELFTKRVLLVFLSLCRKVYSACVLIERNSYTAGGPHSNLDKRGLPKCPKEWPHIPNREYGQYRVHYFRQFGGPRKGLEAA